MLIIRHEQMQALRTALRSTFLNDLALKLRQQRFDAAALDDVVLAAEVRNAVELGERHGIVLADDLRRFVECYFSHGASVAAIEATSWIASVLCRSDLSGSAKMDLLDECELAELRAQWRG